MGLRRERIDSIKEPTGKDAKIAALEAKVAEQQQLNELLKGCIMELADVIYGEEGTTV